LPTYWNRRSLVAYSLCTSRGPPMYHVNQTGARSVTHARKHYRHRRYGRVASEGRRVVAPPCPRSTARLQRSPIGRVESFHSWSSQFFRGRLGGRRHVWPGGRLSDTLSRHPVTHSIKFRRMADVPKLWVTIGYEVSELRGLGGQILPFPTGLRRRPYNTLILPCQLCLTFVVMKTLN